MRTPRTAWARSSGRSTPPPPRTSTRGWTRRRAERAAAAWRLPGARRARDLPSVGRPPLRRRRSLPSPAVPLPRNGRRRRTIFHRGEPEYAILETLRPAAADVVLHKSTVSAFNSSSLDRVLRNMGIECLVVTGVVTDGCVDSTARDGSDLGYDSSSSKTGARRGRRPGTPPRSRRSSDTSGWCPRPTTSWRAWGRERTRPNPADPRRSRGGRPPAASRAVVLSPLDIAGGQPCSTC